mmetsp:Transcript_18512/g.60270  ORF Transcript_18512/g.60270 Transcript_18512/m.60270 type:complete len:249 (+) Transcript_18512:584-1330(+)
MAPRSGTLPWKAAAGMPASLSAYAAASQLSGELANAMDCSKPSSRACVSTRTSAAVRSSSPRMRSSRTRSLGLRRCLCHSTLRTLELPPGRSAASVSQSLEDMVAPAKMTCTPSCGSAAAFSAASASNLSRSSSACHELALLLSPLPSSSFSSSSSSSGAPRKRRLASSAAARARCANPLARPVRHSAARSASAMSCAEASRKPSPASTSASSSTRCRSRSRRKPCASTRATAREGVVTSTSAPWNAR